MMGFFHSAFVIARRDFVATVWSRTFLFFLMGPLLIIGLSFLFGSMSGRMARQDVHATVAVIAAQADFEALQAARERLNPSFGARPLPTLVREEPAGDPSGQVRTLLRNPDKRILAVLTGGLERPTLTGAISGEGPVRRQLSLVVDQARQQRALAAAGRAGPPVALTVVETDR